MTEAWRASQYDRTPTAPALRAWARETGRDARGGSLWRAWRREVWTGAWALKIRRFGMTEEGRELGRKMLMAGEIGHIQGTTMIVSSFSLPTPPRSADAHNGS